MTAGFAELERNLISERTQAALSYKKSKFQVYGAIPYGYTRNGNRLHVHKERLVSVSSAVQAMDGDSLRLLIVRMLLSEASSLSGGSWRGGV